MPRQDRLQIGPFAYKPLPHSAALATLAESEPAQFLALTSTSPHCEPSHYVSDTAAVFRFLAEHPDWRACFAESEQGICFRLAEDGEWVPDREAGA